MDFRLEIQTVEGFLNRGRGYIPCWAASNAQILVQNGDFVLLERLSTKFLLRNSVVKNKAGNFQFSINPTTVYGRV